MSLFSGICSPIHKLLLQSGGSHSRERAQDKLFVNWKFLLSYTNPAKDTHSCYYKSKEEPE